VQPADTKRLATQLKNDPTLDPETCQLSSGDADLLWHAVALGGKIPANDRSRAKLWKDLANPLNLTTLESIIAAAKRAPIPLWVRTLIEASCEWYGIWDYEGVADTLRRAEASDAMDRDVNGDYCRLCAAYLDTLYTEATCDGVPNTPLCVPCAGHCDASDPRHRGSSKYVAERQALARVLSAAVGLVERRTISAAKPGRVRMDGVCKLDANASHLARRAMLERQLLATGENDEVLVPGAYNEFAPTTMSMLHSLPAPAPPPPRSRSQDAAKLRAPPTAKKRKVREPEPTVTERRPCLGEKEIYRRFIQREALRAFADKYACKGVTLVEQLHAHSVIVPPWLAHAVHNFDQCGKVAIETCALNELSAAAAGRNCVRREQGELYMSTPLRKEGRFNKLLAKDYCSVEAQITALVSSVLQPGATPKYADMCTRDAPAERDPTATSVLPRER
jgi:hypothetical protein